MPNQNSNALNILSIDTTKKLAIESNNISKAFQTVDFDVQSAKTFFASIKLNYKQAINYVIVSCSDNDIRHKDSIERDCQHVFTSADIHICAFRAPLFTFWVSKLNRDIKLGEIIAITRVKTDGGVVCGLYARGKENGEDFMAQYCRINAENFGELCSKIRQRNRGLNNVSFLVVYPPSIPLGTIHAPTNAKIEKDFHHRDNDRAQGAIMIAKSLKRQRQDHYIKIEELPREELEQQLVIPQSHNEVIPAVNATSSRGELTSEENGIEHNAIKIPDESNKQKISIGIDIGTTTCKAAVFYKNKSDIVKLDEEDVDMPSYVTFLENKTKTGSEAKKIFKGKNEDETENGTTSMSVGDKEDNSKNTVFDITHYLGKSVNDINIHDYLDYKVKEYRDFVKIELEVATILPEVACGELFKEIARKIDDFLKNEDKFNGVQVTEVILTTPSFMDSNKKDDYETSLKTAAKLAAIKVRSFIDAPTAAVVDYLYKERPRTNINYTLCVIDIGGSNTNITIYSIKTFSEGFTLTPMPKLNKSNPKLGGRNIDISLADSIKKTLRGEDGAKDAGSNYYFLSTAESIKKNLFGKNKTDYNHPSTNEKMTIKLEDFNLKIKFFLESLKQEVEKIITGEEQPINIDKVMLIGKTCKIPKIKTTIKDFFQIASQNFIVDEEISIARGAAIHAVKQLKNSKGAFTYSY